MQYRGISLLPCLYKLYSCILNDRLSTFLEDNAIYVDEQNGFRKGRSCEEHIFTLTSILRNRICTKKSTFVAYIDAEKAFDKINRTLLLYKIRKIGVSGLLYNAIQTIYASSNSYVEFNDLYTSNFSTTRGVRQGDPLSSTLFSIYINDFIYEERY